MLERSPKSYQRFFAELKRRHVFRVMAVYGATAFVLLQVADLLGQGMGLPEVVLKVTTFALLIGFPVAVVLAWAFEQTPQGFKRTESANPEEIDSILAQPALRRWPSGVLALVGVAALVTGAWWVGRQTAPGTAATEGAEPSDPRLVTLDVDHENRPSIAVLPFADMSPRGDQEYFSDGITEELLNTLSKIRDLRVMARTSAFAFKGTNLDIRAVGDSLGARYVVEGSVRKADDQLRITAQLIDAADGAHVWSESYDRRLENVFQIQRDIAEAIAGALRVPLGLDEDAQLVSPTDDLAAYDLYLSGRARMRERGPSVLEAVDLFEAAIARDSNWAPAWAGLAESLTLVPYYASVARDSALWAASLAAAQQAAERALELDPTNPSALVALGSTYRERWEWKEAEAAFVRALSIDPGNVEGIQQYAEFLPFVGRIDDAYRAAQQALALDRSPIRLNAAGYTARLNGRYDEAITLFSQGVEADPEGRVGQLRGNLRHVNLQRENWPEYRRLLMDALHLEDSERAGRLQSIWPESESPTPTIAAWVTDNWSRREGAMIWMELDDHERALDALERWFERDLPPFSSSTPLLVSAYDPIRDEPRFRAILAKRGLEGLTLKRLERTDTP